MQCTAKCDCNPGVMQRISLRASSKTGSSKFRQCRKHEVYYPAELVQEAFRGRFYAFMTSCECSAYLIRTDSDRVRFRGAGDAEGIAAMYADLPGRDIVIRDGRGEFHCKRLPPD